MITEFLVTRGETRKRLDQFLVHREPEISRSSLQRLIELGRIRVNAQVAKSSQKIKPGDRITMDRPEPGPLVVDGVTIPLDILHEDTALLVVDKPAGVVVHPTSGNWSGTLMNALLAHVQRDGREPDFKKDTPYLGLVHRLDKETSGVMVVAKTSEAHQGLSAQFEKHSISRTYEALVWAVPQQPSGIIDVPIGRDRHNSKVCSSNSDDLKPALTEYQVLHSFGAVASHVQLQPRTGRTHQLRVHLASLGCPILGDGRYGGSQVRQIGTLKIPRVMLHASRLGFRHPVSQEPQDFSSALPPEMQTVFESLDRS